MPNTTYNKVLKPYAQKLRREMTPEEKQLWYHYLKHLPCTVKRQQIILNYIVDFYIPSSKLVIELDGSQHFEEEARAKDEQRDRVLRDAGITILRFTNPEVNQHFPDVCQTIHHHLREHAPFD